MKRPLVVAPMLEELTTLIGAIEIARKMDNTEAVQMLEELANDRIRKAMEDMKKLYPELAWEGGKM